MNKKIIFLLIVLLILPNVVNVSSVVKDNKDRKILEFVFEVSSTRKIIDDIVIIPDNDALFGSLGSYISCWYNNNGSSGLQPLLIHENGTFDNKQTMFIDSYFSNDAGSLLNLGVSIDTDYEVANILGSSVEGSS